MNRTERGAYWLTGVALLALLGAGGLYAVDQPSAERSRAGPNFTPEARELLAGRAMFDEYLSAVPLWPGDRVNEYVNRLGQNMIRAAGAPGPFVFRVVRSSEPNAQAFPGGFIVVHSGIIALAESESELAAVLAHEIAHVQARHWQRQRIRLSWYCLLATVPLAITTSPIAWFAFYGAAAASPLARARFSRALESEADCLAVDYLMAAGYDPESALSFMARYQAARIHGGKGKCTILSTHPSVEKRMTIVRKHLRLVQRPASLPSASQEFEKVRAEVMASPAAFPGDDARLAETSDAPPPPVRQRSFETPPSCPRDPSGEGELAALP